MGLTQPSTLSMQNHLADSGTKRLGNMVLTNLLFLVKRGSNSPGHKWLVQEANKVGPEFVSGPFKC